MIGATRRTGISVEENSALVSRCRLASAARLGDVHVAFEVDADAIDRVRQTLVGEIRSGGLRLMLEPDSGHSCQAADKSIRISKRERPEQDAVHQRENRDGRTDADGERQHRGDEKAGERLSERTA